MGRCGQSAIGGVMFPEDGAQTQTRSWTSIFITSCTRLCMYRSLGVVIPSAGNCVRSCGHSRSFSVLDHVKNFMIASASASWSRLHEKSCRREHDLRRCDHHFFEKEYLKFISYKPVWYHKVMPVSAEYGVIVCRGCQSLMQAKTSSWFQA